MSYQLEQIIKQKSKAFSVLTKTRKQLAEVVDQAQKFLTANRKEIDAKFSEINDLKAENQLLLDEMALIEKSITETDRILQPTIQ